MSRIPRAAFVAVVAFLVAAGPAAGPGVAAADPTPRSTPAGHKGQFGGSVRLGLGLRGISTYDDTDYCGERSVDTGSGNAVVCIDRAPFAFDLELSYGVTDRIEVLGELRLGLERDFAPTAAGGDGPRPLHLSPGLRVFFSEAGTSRLFTTGQVVFDFTGYEDATGTSRGSDVGVRNLNGLWFDLDDSYGFYGYVGETLSFSRWLRFELEAGVGFQGRYP
ncbi:MAG: hypothetical protein KA297_08210 [Kofleriaceae bacterium]|nr:hypothetical protein [Kofleriaceae bacterium]MBP6838216.1 hypothetical protein [Kofleriaceae bacterium]